MWTKNTTEKDWKPTISFENSKHKDYFLINDFPTCKPGEAAVLPNLRPNQEVKMYSIYPNGSAQISGEARVHEPFDFCGDYLVSGESDYHDYIIR